MSILGYSREVREVVCGSCGEKAMDINVENYHYDTTNDENIIYCKITMPCKCGGNYQYQDRYESK